MPVSKIFSRDRLQPKVITRSKPPNLHSTSLQSSSNSTFGHGRESIPIAFLRTNSEKSRDLSSLHASLRRVLEVKLRNMRSLEVAECCIHIIRLPSFKRFPLTAYLIICLFMTVADLHLGRRDTIYASGFRTLLETFRNVNLASQCLRAALGKHQHPTTLFVTCHIRRIHFSEKLASVTRFPSR